jgi:hypothetical protein
MHEKCGHESNIIILEVFIGDKSIVNWVKNTELKEMGGGGEIKETKERNRLGGWDRTGGGGGWWGFKGVYFAVMRAIEPALQANTRPRKGKRNVLI